VFRFHDSDRIRNAAEWRRWKRPPVLDCRFVLFDRRKIFDVYRSTEVKKAPKPSIVCRVTPE